MKKANSKNSRVTGSIVISTFATRNSANKIAKEMITRKLCACVNIMRINSFYYWKNKIHYGSEYLCFFKTITSAKLICDLKKVHPYELPEIVEIRTDNVEKDYLGWLSSAAS